MTLESLALPGGRRISLPVALLAVATAVSGVLLLVLQSHLTFFIDDWDLLLHRRGLSAHDLLAPHGEHITVAPAIIYKAIQATFGMGSIVPYAVPSTAAFLASAVLLFVYVRRRVGGWLALAATVPILFMGSAYEDLLTPFQIGFFGAMACGLGALLMLERRDRRGDAIACALLVASLTFSEVGVPFVIGAAVAIGLDRGPRRRAYVVAIPLILYAIWFLGWGQYGTDQRSFDNLATSPSYVLDGFASSMSSLLGLPSMGTSAPLAVNPAGLVGALEWGRPLLVMLLVLLAIRLRFLGRIPRWLWIAAAIGVSFWFLTATNASFGRPPTASRYQYVGAVFAILIAAGLASGWKAGWRTQLAALAVAALATLSNLSYLHEGYTQLRDSTAVVRGGLGGLEIAANRVSPNFVLTSDNSDFNYFTLVDAGSYLSAADKFGSPAYSPTELTSAPQSARIAADRVVAAAEGLALRPASSLPHPAGPAPRLVSGERRGVPAKPSCLTVAPAVSAPSVVSLPPGGATLRAAPGSSAQVTMARYTMGAFPLELGTLRGGAVLGIPTDSSMRPWEIEIDGSAPVTVCGMSAG